MWKHLCLQTETKMEGVCLGHAVGSGTGHCLTLLTWLPEGQGRLSGWVCGILRSQGVWELRVEDTLHESHCPNFTPVCSFSFHYKSNIENNKNTNNSGNNFPEPVSSGSLPFYWVLSLKALCPGWQSLCMCALFAQYQMLLCLSMGLEGGIVLIMICSANSLTISWWDGLFKWIA